MNRYEQMATPPPLTVEIPDLGPCCACGIEGPGVRNVILLGRKAPVPGTGWGCIVCGLPLDGAIAVVCDPCLETQAEIRFACYGAITNRDRIALALLSGQHRHDPAKHPDAENME